MKARAFVLHNLFSHGEIERLSAVYTVDIHTNIYSYISEDGAYMVHANKYLLDYILNKTQ